MCTWLLEKKKNNNNTNLTIKNFFWQVVALPFNILSRFVRAFLLRGKCLLISRLQSLFTVISKHKIRKSVTTSTFLLWTFGTGSQDPKVLNVEFQAGFSLSSFTLIKKLFSFSSPSAIRVIYLNIWGYWYFSQQSWFQFVSYPAQHFTWCTYSAWMLNKQGGNIYSRCTPLPIWNQLVFPCLVLTAASWSTYGFLRRQVNCSVIPIFKNFPQFVVIHMTPN